MIRDVTNVLFIQDNQVLLGMKKRGFGKQKYNGFGGKLNPGETILAAALREAEEESGLVPLAYYKAAIIDFPDSYDLRMHLYVCTKWEGEPHETEEMLPRWFPFSHIPYDQMWDDDAYWFDYIIHGKKIIASFTFEHNQDTDGTSINHVVSQSIVEVEHIDD